jgi:hypothetical protein
MEYLFSGFVYKTSNQNSQRSKHTPEPHMVAFSKKLAEDVENTMKVYHELLPLAATEADKEALREEYKQRTQKMIYDYDDIATKNAIVIAQQKEAAELEMAIKKKRVNDVKEANMRERESFKRSRMMMAARSTEEAKNKEKM